MLISWRPCLSYKAPGTTNPYHLNLNVSLLTISWFDFGVKFQWLLKTTVAKDRTGIPTCVSYVKQSVIMPHTHMAIRIFTRTGAEKLHTESLPAACPTSSDCQHACHGYRLAPWRATKAHVFGEFLAHQWRVTNLQNQRLFPFSTPSCTCRFFGGSHELTKDSSSWLRDVKVNANIWNASYYCSSSTRLLFHQPPKESIRTFFIFAI